jgi:ABC-type branched-subunit amino acid transport system substrate-binding protein
MTKGMLASGIWPRPLRTTGQSRPRVARSVAVLGAGALVLAGCGSDDDGDDTDASSLSTDVGVTAEACPDAVNPDNGCIYLGVLSDLSEGPFVALAQPGLEGLEDFWQRVNENGGIGGYDIDVTENVRDNKYDPQTQSQAYREIEPNILALAVTLGTPPTQAILGDMDADDVIGAPASWWSGWSFPEEDDGLILESGHSYCIESMVGLDWFTEEKGEPQRVLAVGYPGDYGGDYAAGAEAWAEANDVTYAGFVETGPNAVVNTQDAAVEQVVDSNADVVAIAVGPLETAEIIGKAAAEGFTGQFVGAVPTWNPALLESEAAPAIEALYTQVAPFEAFGGDTEAHQAMNDALGGEAPANDGYTWGWVWQYPMKAALEAAVENGDLTRAGLRSVVDGLEVDYEGILPTATYGEDPNATVDRTAVIATPDPEAPLAISAVATGVTGETADAYDYTAACSATG